MNTINNFSLRLLGAQLVNHIYSAKDEDVILELYLSCSLGFQISRTGVDLSCLQRTAEGSSESTGCCGNNVVDCCCVRREGVRRNFVVLSYLGMNSEMYWLTFEGQICQSLRTLFPYDSDTRCVDDLLIVRIGHVRIQKLKNAAAY
jgi:hypothetical protein